MIRNQPDKGGGGRRPLLVTFTGNNRQMLNEIRDNLSHLRRNDNLVNDPSNIQLTQDLSQSTPNLLEKSAANKGVRRDNQHHKALAEIRDSLRPYQNATQQTNGSYASNRNNNGAAVGGGNGAAIGGGNGGGGSDNSSTASSSSSHITLDQDVSASMAMIQEVMKHGFDKEIAVHALRLSGNQSVDAALRLLQYMMDKIKEGRYPPGPPPQSVLPTYHHTRPSFGPGSPTASDCNSIRSDSPGLNQGPGSHRHLLANGLQTPPPLPPRVPITASQTASSGHIPPSPSSTPTSLGAGVIDGTAKLSISSSVSTNQLAQQSLPNQSSGMVVGGPHINKGKMGGAPTGLFSHNAVLDQSDIPQGHVKQIIQLISPPTSQPCYPMQQHKQHQNQQAQQSHAAHQPQPQVPQMNGGPPVGMIGQRGVSPVPGINCQQQPIIMGTNSNNSASNTPAPSPLLSQQFHMILNAQSAGSASSNSPSPAPSSGGSSSVQHSFPQGPPPPYSQAQAQIQAARLGIVLPSGAPMMATNSEHSSGGVSSENQKKLVANKAVSATCMPMDSSHLPVIMKSVKSKEVQKPMPQTATIPMVPPTSGLNGMQTSSGSPGFSSPVHHNHLTHHKQLAPPVPSTAFPVSSSSRVVVMTGKRDVNVNNIHITHSQPHYHPHLLRSAAGQDENLTQEQLAAVAAASTAQPTILNPRTRQEIFSQNHKLNVKNSDQCNNNTYNIKTNANPFPDPALSTPRSDSPVSRVTNQSPLSVLSTTSSPSTNSDIPERLPPPYPGRLIGQSSHTNPPAPPLLPPRVPLKPITPPPPPDSDQFHNHSPPLVSMPKHQPPSHLPSVFTQDQSSSSSSPSPSSPVHVTGSIPSHSLPGPSASNSPYAQPPFSSNAANNLASNLQQTNSNANNLVINGNKNDPPNSVLSSETEETDTDTSIVSQTPSPAPSKSSNNQEKHRCMSPLPERNMEAKERDQLRSDTKVRNYSPQAFKFYMEQHVENVLKSHSQRVNRKLQLEKEMAKAKLSDEAACQMRKMLHQKESNYIRLKRAKMDSSMFEKIKTLGVGAFGEVALVRKKDVGNLYAMKTLQKSNVIKRNQVAHVKAERDILAEADNEWVVKLYYSFQDQDNLYFVMDYVPGGDLMGLLIREEILEEHLARFYIAELVLAIESVHRMGFIHRDIKPDNILIDQEGHIKLTDFGLCTGFRWTHNSKYYQKDGTHARQDSMEVSHCQLDDQCRCEILKPLIQRRQREQKRCLAHSLVGTPNYIAPEVLLRQGYTKACDWWSVGVILYEMVVGSPPFYASTPAETQYKVMNWKETLSIRHDVKISVATSNFITRLLQGSDTRLGKDGASQVKEHLFFEGINFEGLRRQPAPHKPTIRSMTDTSNFDPVDSDKLQTNDSDCSKKVDSKQENGKLPEHAFYEFTFRRFFDDGGPPSLPPPPESTETNSPVYV